VLYKKKNNIFALSILCVTDDRVFIYVFCDCWHNPIEN